MNSILVRLQFLISVAYFDVTDEMVNSLTQEDIDEALLLNGVSPELIPSMYLHVSDCRISYLC